MTRYFWPGSLSYGGPRRQHKYIYIIPCCTKIYPSTKISIPVQKMHAFIIPLLRQFTILGQKNAQNTPRYYTVKAGKNTDGTLSNRMAGETSQTLTC